MRASLLVVAVAGLIVTLPAAAQQTAAVTPARVEITPATAVAEVGQTLTFTAAAFDATGGALDLKPTAWFAAPFDSAAPARDGAVTFVLPGEIRVGAIVGGKPGFAVVTVKPQAPARIDIAAMPGVVPVGGVVAMTAVPRTGRGDPLSAARVAWTSDQPSIAAIDDAGVVTGVAPGRATLTARSGPAKATTTVTVAKQSVGRLSIEPRNASARTGDVVRFAARADGRAAAVVRWSVSGPGAAIESDGAFVAERPGSYVVTAAGGDRAAAASVLVTPREVQRPLEIVGRTPLEEFQTLEQWIVGNYAYVTSYAAGRLWVYDISNPASPLKVDSLAFDARTINDISTTPDGTLAVLTREGASNRKNGVVFLDTSDPAHPKVLSEYTATVTGGVHSAFIDGHYVYLTDDATGSLRIIDFQDPKQPKEVGRWEVDEPLARTVETPEGDISGGRYVHDVQVKDGLAYVAYWRHGLVILDVGNGLKKGSPERPALVSELRFNYHELYGSGWLAGAHAVFRYKNYVFVGDEVFPALFNLNSRDRIPVKGALHVVDVSDIEHPRRVAVYEVPEGGAHNVWALDDILYMGYYNAGARVLDVSGELRGDLYRQGREIASLWTGDPKGYRPNLPFCWGAQPHNGLIYFNDIHSGIWIARLTPEKKPRQPTTP